LELKALPLAGTRSRQLLATIPALLAGMKLANESLVALALVALALVALALVALALVALALQALPLAGTRSRQLLATIPALLAGMKLANESLVALALPEKRQ
jgi:hypothetical protein